MSSQSFPSSHFAVRPVKQECRGEFSQRIVWPPAFVKNANLNKISIKIHAVELKAKREIQIFQHSNIGICRYNIYTWFRLESQRISMLGVFQNIGSNITGWFWEDIPVPNFQGICSSQKIAAAETGQPR